MSNQREITNRKKVEAALRVLESVLQSNDHIASRVGDDIGSMLMLPVNREREHGAKYTTATGDKTHRGLARLVFHIIQSDMKELFS